MTLAAIIEFTNTKWINYTLFSLLVLVIAYTIHRVLRMLLTRFLRKSSADLNVDPTNYTFLNNALGLLVFFIALLVVLNSFPEVREIGVTLFAGAGIFAAIIGFASQAAFSNIISGIFIVIFKPFRVGDVVTQTNYRGIIEDITLRHVVIRDFENRRYVVPNSIISTDVIHNSSLYEEATGNFVIVSISYDSDLDLAMSIMQDEAMAHPLLIDRRSAEEVEDGAPLVQVRVINLGDSSVDLRATCWTADFIKGFELKTDLYRAIKLRFDREGIEIPFPHRTIVTKTNGKVT